MPTAPHSSVESYLRSLPAERRAALEALRAVILENLDPRFEEGIQYGMPGYFLPHGEYPAGYHCDPRQPLPFASFASQKNHMALYLFCLYTDPEAVASFAREWRATGKRLDMGKSCVRFKRLEDLPLEVIGRAVAAVTAERFVASYEAQLEGSGARRRGSGASAGGKQPASKSPSKKVSGKKTVRKATAEKAGSRATKKVASRRATKRR
jgi:uncharacterized protein YdhG (YjbR/CyaY superfamily)